MKKQEEKQEEVVVENEVGNDYVPTDTPVVEPINYDHEVLKNIEDTRAKYFSKYRMINSIRIAFAAITAVGAILTMVFIPVEYKWRIAVPIGIVVLAFAVLVLTHKLNTKRLDEYLHQIVSKYNEYVFGGEGFSDVELQTPWKIDLDLLVDTRLYANLIEVRSRGLTEFNYNSIPFRIVDCAGNIRGPRGYQPVFIGKLVHSACKYTDGNTVAIYFKGTELPLPPTNTDNLKVAEDNDKMIIYGSKTDVKKAISPKVRAELNKIETNKFMCDLAFSMHDGKVYACIGCSDSLMVPPNGDQFNPKPLKQFKKDLAQVVKVMEALNK